jgi:putative endonuclease
VKKVKDATNSDCWFLYIVKCSDTTLYTGTTNNIAKRITAHNSGMGAKYTQGRGPVTLVHLEEFPDRSRACQREAVIKKLPKLEKQQLHNQVQ